MPFRKDGRKAWGPDTGSRTTLDAPAPAVPPAHPGRHHGTSRGGFCGDLWRFYEDVVGIVTRSSYIYMNIVMGISMNFMYISEDFMGLYEDIL